ncbi:MAG: S-layer homology domain-containing protein [Firmicutes bacterium]|nr:S-layer homology domain-containing protein [Bacillota bacterium]
MKGIWIKLSALTLVLALVFAMSTGALAADKKTVDAAAADTAAYLVKTVTAPTVGSVGGDWAVFGLARAGAAVPAGYFDAYYAAVVKYLQDNKGVLSARKYTEYSRVILALTAIGRDPAAAGGYDLTKYLADKNAVAAQGVNGAAYALLALNAGKYGSADLRGSYVDIILAAQLADGGWDLSGVSADPDLTAMCLQALAPYTDLPQVKSAVDNGLSRLSALQNTDGGFATVGSATCESCAQVIVALGELGIDVNDSRFVKNGHSAMDALLGYYTKGQGFAHIKGGSANGMATEQAYYALVSYQRQSAGKNSLYDMSDAAVFSDIAGHQYKAEIEALAKGGFVAGMGDGTFRPAKVLTRAEFATLVVKALSLPGKNVSVFNDVRTTDWFSPYVGAAYDYGMIAGRSATVFDPQGTISDSEADLILDRVAVKLGVKDSVTVVWQPSSVTVDRGQAAHLLYQLLSKAGKL